MSGIIGKLDSRIIEIIFLYALGNKTIFPDYRSTGELRVKETDRIKAMVQGLKYCGVDVTEYYDGFTVQGKGRGSFMNQKY